MKIVIGLGNPGKEYLNTRHNTGLLFIEILERNKLPKDVSVKKSDVFMNDSGQFVKRIVNNSAIQQYNNLYIVHDDLDILLGSYKIQFGRGPKDHNGLRSIDETLGTDQYWHVRIGVDNRPLDNRPMGEEYVLQNFSDEEREILDNTIKKACRELVDKYVK
jgi:peptidyl-tRNA hydrolase, PTH1 family